MLMTTTESLDTRVLRVGGFAVAAFVLGVILTGFVHGGSGKAATAAVCPDGTTPQATSLAHAPRAGQRTPADILSCS
jgi:hypothetical protein